MKTWNQHLQDRRSQHVRIIADVESGKYKNSEIAKKYGMTHQGVSFLKVEYGLKKGRTKHTARFELLNRRDLPKILAEIESGVRTAEIGKKYGAIPRDILYLKHKHGIKPRKRD